MKTITFRATRLMTNDVLKASLSSITKIDPELFSYEVKTEGEDRDVYITMPDELDSSDIFELGMILGKAMYIELSMIV